MQIWSHWQTPTFNRRSKLCGMYLYMSEMCISWNQHQGHPREFGTWPELRRLCITRLRIDHSKAVKSHILSQWPPTACQHYGQTLTIEHILLECIVLQQSRDGYYTIDSLRTLSETIPEACIIECLRDAWFFYLVRMAIYPVQLFIKISHQLTTFLIWINLHYLTTQLDFVYRA